MPIKEKITKWMLKNITKNSLRTMIIQSPHIIIWGTIWVLLMTIITYMTFIVIAFLSMLWWKSDASTSLTYYEGENFYWMPYNASYEVDWWKYDSVFKQLWFLTADEQQDKININNKIEKILKSKKLKDITTDCWTKCDSQLSELYQISFNFFKMWQIDNWSWVSPFFKKFVNVDTWRDNVSYIYLNLQDNIRDKNYKFYLYDTANWTIDNSSISTFADNDIIGDKTLYLKYKDKFKIYETEASKDLLWRWMYDEIDETSAYKNINNYIDNYFLSKNNIIDRIYNTWEKFIDETEERKFSVEVLSKILDPKVKWWVWEEIKNSLHDIISKDSERLYNSAVTDMMNFSWIKGAEDRQASLSNQYLLSQEKINLEYFNKIPFWKDYKNMIINTSNFNTLTLDDAKKILTFKDELNKDSDEFGVLLKDKIKYDYQTNGFINYKPLNDKNIIREGEYFYSPDITYSQITKWQSDKSNCSIVFPAKRNNDYITYTQEALYTWQKVKVMCTNKKGDPSYYSYNAPDLIQKAEVTFYKKFIFKSENKKSDRNDKEYFLNYFFDKEYINQNSNVLEKISLVNDIYLDRESIIFRWIYMKISWFWIEIKDEWNFITAKKNSDWYSMVLPDAPINIEIWVLTELNKKVSEINIFEAKNNIHKTWQYLSLSELQDKANILDENKNVFFKLFENWLYKINTNNYFKSNFNQSSYFRDNRQELSDEQKWLMELLYKREEINQKNSYFYTVMQNQKLDSILDKLYLLDQDTTTQAEFFKKYLILTSNFINNPNYNNLVNNYRQQFQNKTPFKTTTDNFIYDDKIYNINSFDKCNVFNFVHDSYNRALWSMQTSKSNDIKYNLLNTCYNQYIPFRELKIKVNPDKDISQSDAEFLNKLIITDFGANEFSTYLNEAKIYKYISDDRFIIEWLTKSDLSLYKILEDERKTDKKDNQWSMNFWLKDLFVDLNNNNKIFEKYKETKEYSENCNDNETLKWNAINTNFKCSLSWIYDEFMSKLSADKQSYYFIKEEYLKEKVDIEPFNSYYNPSILDNCNDSYICSEDRDGSVSTYVPLEYNISPLKSQNSNFIKINEWTTTISSFTDYYKNVNPDTIWDFSYNFDLNKSFSYEEENYNPILDLHTVYLNPNLYLHSFIRWVKEKSNKYQINVYWTWFNGILNEWIKKELEKEYIWKLNNFLINNVSNKKVVYDLLNVLTWNWSWIKYDITNNLLDFSKYWTTNTTNNNLFNYVDNVKLWSIVSKVTGNTLNRDNLSNYNLTFSKEYIDNLPQEKKRIIERFLYWIYVLNLLSEHYNTTNNNIETDLLNNVNNYNDLLNSVSDTDIVAKLYKDVLLLNWWYLPPSNVEWYNAYKFWNINSVEDLFEENVWELYELSEYYKNNKNNSDIKKAVDLLKNPNYYKEYNNLYTEQVKDETWKIKILNTIDLKKEKVLLLNKFYWDFIWIISAQQEEISKQLKENNTWQDETWNNKTEVIVDINYITSIIERQLWTILILKKNYPDYYYQYYLNPILTNVDLDSEWLKKLNEIFKNIIWKDYKIETEVQDYYYYMNIIKQWLNINDEWNDNIISLPLNKIDSYYWFAAQDKSSIDIIRTSFIDDNDTKFLPAYNILSDLFWNRITNWAVKTISIKQSEKIDIDISLIKIEIENKEKVLQQLETLYKTNKAWNILTNINIYKGKIDELNNDINILEDIKSKIDVKNEVYYSYQVTVKNKAIQLTKWDITKSVADLENNKYKPVFFNWPFSPKKSWFFAYNYWNAKDSKFIMDAINSQMAMSFMLQNLRATEDGIKNIIDEMAIYTSDVNNKKINSLPDYENIWNFSPYYLNNWFVSTNGSDTLKIELILKIEWSENAILWGASGDFSIWSIQNWLVQQAYNKNFENLKTTYCWKITENSKKSNCIAYMDYLKTLNPSSLKWELQYMTTALHTKNSAREWKYFINETYSTLARKLPANSVAKQEMQEWWLSNSAYLWQCTWYVKLLKNKNITGNGKDYYYNWWRLWYATDFINPKVDSIETMMGKIQVGDIVSFQWRNSASWYCNTSWDAWRYWHVAVIIWKNPTAWTVKIAQSNVKWVMLIDATEYSVKKLCPAWLVHWVEWRY